jgi:hypothetical protein
MLKIWEQELNNVGVLLRSLNENPSPDFFLARTMKLAVDIIPIREGERRIAAIFIWPIRAYMHDRLKERPDFSDYIRDMLQYIARKRRVKEHEMEGLKDGGVD